MQNIVPHGNTAAVVLIISSAVAPEGSSEGDAIHYFRLKNGWDYQNAWVAPAPHQLLFKKVVLVSFYVLVVIN